MRWGTPSKGVFPRQDHSQPLAWCWSPSARRIRLLDRDVLESRIASEDETMMFPAMLDTGRQTQLAVHGGPVTQQWAVRRHRAVRRLRTPAHAALAFICHGA